MRTYKHLTINASDLEELVAVGEVVVGHVDVPSLLIIVATVVVASRYRGPLFSIGSHEVDIRVGVDLRLLQGSQLRAVQSQSLVGSEGTTQLSAAPPVPDSMRARGFTGALAGFGAAGHKNTAMSILGVRSSCVALEDAFFGRLGVRPPYLSTLRSLDRLETGAGLLGV